MEGKKGKRSYTVELGEVKWYNENGENNYATERQFWIDRKHIPKPTRKGLFMVALAS